MSEHESLILDLRILRDCDIEHEKQCSIVNQAIATIEDLKRQLANADSILDEQIKARDATIEELLRLELQSAMTTANLGQSKYDLVCYELGMVGSKPSEVVERIRSLQTKVQIEQNVVKVLQAENCDLRECNKSLQYKVKDMEALLSHQCS